MEKKTTTFKARGATWQVQPASGTYEEEEASRQVGRLLAQYDLSKWTFTTQLRIDNSGIPHSHPILTLNTSYLEDDERALSVLVHEQLHWLLYNDREKAKEAIHDFRQLYPNAPSKPPQGAQGEFSTYLHLIVNCLEYLELQELLGVDRARSILELSAKSDYAWIYGTVRDAAKVSEVLRHHGLARQAS